MQDIPLDPTGELDEFRHFIEDNIDLCKWIGIIVISTQVELMAINHISLCLFFNPFCGRTLIFIRRIFLSGG